MEAEAPNSSCTAAKIFGVESAQVEEHAKCPETIFVAFSTIK
jgi:hypothetical protein